jgi:hypothetical protein
MALGELALGLVLRLILDRPHPSVDFFRKWGPERDFFWLRVGMNGFFALGIFLYLNFGFQAGWNGLRVLTLAGYIDVTLVQLYFLLKTLVVRQQLPQGK